MTRYRRRESGLYVPAGMRGFRGASVGTLSGAGVGVGGRFSAVAGAVITALDPSTGSTAGGGTLTVWGTGFLDGDVIRIDGSNQTTTYVTSGKLTCTIPAHAAGSINVVVRRGVTDSNAATFEFTTGGGLPADVVFASNFMTGTGSGDAALRDTSRLVPWDTVTGNGNNTVATAVAEGITFPSANVLKVIGVDGGTVVSARIHRVAKENSRWAIPTVGNSLYYRWYIIVVWPDNAVAGLNGAPHPIQCGHAASDANWMMETTIQDNGTWGPRVFSFSNNGANAYPNNRWNAPTTFTKNSLYRVELRIKLLSSTTFEPHARIYDSSGVLLYTDTDIKNANATSSFADNVALNLNASDGLNALDSFQCGTNGPTGNLGDVFPFTCFYQGGFLVRTADWCGAYSTTEETF